MVDYTPTPRKMMTMACLCFGLLILTGCGGSPNIPKKGDGETNATEKEKKEKKDSKATPKTPADDDDGDDGAKDDGKKDTKKGKAKADPGDPMPKDPMPKDPEPKKADPAPAPKKAEAQPLPKIAKGDTFSVQGELGAKEFEGELEVLKTSKGRNESTVIEGRYEHKLDGKLLGRGTFTGSLTKGGEWSIQFKTVAPVTGTFNATIEWQAKRGRFSGTWTNGGDTGFYRLKESDD